MHFQISIGTSLDNVWSAFNNRDNMGRWQQNFSSYSQQSGDAGQVGSIAELRYNENGKETVLKETITERRDKSFLAATFESIRGRTMIVNQFQKIEIDKTRWSSWCNFTFTGFMRIVSPFIAGAIRKRVDGDMQRFKLMVETDEAGEVG